MNSYVVLLRVIVKLIGNVIEYTHTMVYNSYHQWHNYIEVLLYYVNALYYFIYIIYRHVLSH